MYDSIDCHYPLPMPEDPKGYIGSDNFQTKDLDLALSSYIIDENGQLFIERHEGEWIEGNKDSKSIFEEMDHFKTTKKWLEQLNTTTTVAFYDYQQSDKTDYDYMIEYEAVFIGGKISSVKLINFEATSNSKRKKSDEEFKIKLGQRRDFVETWRYKYIYHPYNNVLRAVVRRTTTWLGRVNSLIFKLESKIRI